LADHLQPSPIDISCVKDKDGSSRTDTEVRRIEVATVALVASRMPPARPFLPMLLFAMP
jgi:hypothetical protein